MPADLPPPPKDPDARTWAQFWAGDPPATARVRVWVAAQLLRHVRRLVERHGSGHDEAARFVQQVLVELLPDRERVRTSTRRTGSFPSACRVLGTSLRRLHALVIEARDFGRPSDSTVRRFRKGDPSARAVVMLWLMTRLDAPARRKLGPRPRPSFTPSELCSRVVTRILAAKTHWKNADHLLASALRAMQWEIIDHGRGRHGDGQDVSADDVADPASARGSDSAREELEELLERLAQEHPAAATAFEYRYIFGFDIETIAVLTGRKARSVARALEYARARLARWLRPPDGVYEVRVPRPEQAALAFAWFARTPSGLEVRLTRADAPVPGPDTPAVRWEVARIGERGVATCSELVRWLVAHDVRRARGQRLHGSRRGPGRPGDGGTGAGAGVLRGGPNSSGGLRAAAT